MKRMIDEKKIDFLDSVSESMRYNSDTNTLEVGTNLYVDGNTILTCLEIRNTDSTSDGIFFNDTERNVAHIGNDGTYFYFEIVDEDGEFTQDYATLEILEDKGGQNILTDKNAVTFFGDKTIFGPGNIDLYRHQLTGSLLDNNVIYMQIISSRNTVIDSIQDLTTVTKAVSGYVVNGIVRVDGIMYAAYISYNGSTWNVSYNGTSSSIKTVADVVTTI